ncbi:MAG: HAD hydrolase-like protein [Balneolales bacterium]|nr:HAD hydrolase-like protein [Balneolales bacterium]
MSKKLVLFDIDGTLIRMKKHFMPGLMLHLLTELGGELSQDSEMKFAGRTDRDIFSEIIDLYRLNNVSFDLAKEKYLSALAQMLTPEDVITLDGARLTIEKTIDAGHEVALLTGNFEEAAFIKIDRAGLGDFFSYGAFGCNHKERKDLPSIAFELGKKRLGDQLQPEDLIIIGDTPNDIFCAQYFGAKSVAVATGPYTKADLIKHKPDILLSDLSKPEEWVPMIYT